MQENQNLLKKKKRWNKSVGYKYDSKWEEKLVKGIFKGLAYHPECIEYERPATSHKYHPDWKIDSEMKHPKDKGREVIYIEAKGRFRDRNEYTKYIHIREALCDDEELVFLFMKPDCPMPGAKRRKDGSINTHAGWAEKNGFRWFDEKTIHEILRGIKKLKYPKSLV